MTRSRQLWTQAGQGGDTSTYTLDLAGLALANPHGDVVTTVTVPDSGPAAGIDSWHAYDEHGNTIIGTIGEPPLKDTTGIGYGWVGNEQRATQITGLLLTGARLYNPTTGTFTSMDPVFGGNSTTYAYPQDPIGTYDLDGKFGCGWCKSVAKARIVSIETIFLIDPSSLRHLGVM